MIVQQLICDNCGKVILEKKGELYLNEGQFPISEAESRMLTENTEVMNAISRRYKKKMILK